nr:PREDICTED: sodium- and chloride-dependent GABA transporter 2-like [Paralichthys olivaceus]XP_019969061.1 PREDICTED: sodium- and chloride-dependent GABA transporter 2-like [Paralichthys olivaceus]
MTGYNPLPVFKLCWKYLTPAVCTATFAFSLVCWAPLSLGKGLVAPVWATTLGWLLTLSSVSLLPFWAIYALVTTPGSLTQRFQHLCSPAKLSSSHHLPTNYRALPYSPALPLTEKPKQPVADVVHNPVT